MPKMYLSQLDLPVSGGIYIDCGIIFPFFYKNADHINIVSWLNDICAWANRFPVKTTSWVKRESNRAFNKVPIHKRYQKKSKSLYNSLFCKIQTVGVNVDYIDPHPVLSRADLSLLHRPDKDSVLLTSDRALHFADQNSILLRWNILTNELYFSTEKV